MKTKRTKAEKMDILKATNNVDLLKLFCQYTCKFNPIDEDFCETYELMTGEILSRMEERGNV